MAIFNSYVKLPEGNQRLSSVENSEADLTQEAKRLAKTNADAWLLCFRRFLGTDFTIKWDDQDVKHMVKYDEKWRFHHISSYFIMIYEVFNRFTNEK